MPINAPRTLIEQNIVDDDGAAQVGALIAFIVGPDYTVRNYADDSAAVSLGQYTDADVTVSWPGRQAGEVVDQAFTTVQMENARLQYFEDLIGSGDVYAPVAGFTNRIAAAANIFADGNGFSRTVAIPTDVVAGDQLRLETTGAEVLNTYVKSVVAEVIDDVIAAAVANGANASTQVAADSITPDGGNSGDITSESSDGSAYDGLVAGLVSETYTLTVTQASTGGDHTTAILAVSSTSGTDDQAAVVPSATTVATAIGTRGMAVTFTGGDFAVGDIWVVTVDQVYTISAPTSAGDYVGTSDTVYRIRVIRGGALSGNVTTGAAVEVTTLNGIDSSGPHYPIADTPLAVGTLGVTFDLDSSGTSNAVTGDEWTVNVTAEAAGKFSILELTNDLPATHSGEADFNLRVSIEKFIEVEENRLSSPPNKNFEQTTTDITLKSGITSTDARVAVGVTLTELAVWQGDAFTSYRALRTADANELKSIILNGTAESTVTTRFGSTDPDGVLNFGVLCALDGAASTEVRYIAIESDDLAGYTAALSSVTEVNPGWGFVPLTTDEATRQIFQDAVNSRSSAEEAKWAAAWFGQDLVTVQSIATADENGSELQATVLDDPSQAGTQYTLVNDAGGDGAFISNGVKAGDTLRTQYTTDGFGNELYQEYAIDVVVSEESLRLLSGPSSEISLASKYEIHRSLSISEQAQDYIDRASVHADRRVRIVFPAAPKRLGVTYPNYFLAATLAGVRSNSYPHQPISNTDVPGWDDMSQAAIEFNAELNNLLNGGIWIVTQAIGTQGVTGSPFTYRQITTDNSGDLRNIEDSVVSNIDSISFVLNDAFSGVTGRQNIYPGQIDKINAQLNSVLESLGEIAEEDFGPQVIRFEIIALRQHAVFRDRVFAQIQVTVPSPLNELQIQMDVIL